MLSEKLEILLITYNRHEFLDKTLNQVEQSVFRDCKITVLDNCSTDATPSVCAKYAAKLPDLHIVRHRLNIGPGANYLRAIERACARYAWVICDDDVFDFSKVDDVVREIEEGHSDLIVVGTYDDLQIEQGVHTTTQNLVRKGSRYFSIALFIPSVIFRSELFDSKCIREGYNTIYTLYCTFPFYNQMLAQNASVYVCENQILRTGGNRVHGFSYFDLAVAQLDVFKSIQDKRARHQTIEEVVFIKGFFSIAGHIVLAKALYKSAFVFYKPIAAKKTFAAISGLSFTQKVKFFVGLMFLLAPVGVCKMVRNRYLASGHNKLSSEEEAELVRAQKTRAQEL